MKYGKVDVCGPEQCLEEGMLRGFINEQKLLQPIKDEYSGVAYEAASATAVEEVGGHKIPMKHGRVDVCGPEQCPEEGMLRDVVPPPAGQLREVFYKMGPGDKLIISLQSGVSGKDGQSLRTKASGGGSDSHSTQEKCPWMARMVSEGTNLYELNYIKGTTVLIRRYDRGWLIMCDSRVSWINANYKFRFKVDDGLKCTLAAHLNHVSVSSGMMEISCVIQSKVRGYICRDSEATMGKIWSAVQHQIRDRLSQKFPDVNRSKQVESAKLMIVSRANLKYFMVIIAKRKIGELIFDVKPKMMTHCSFGSGSGSLVDMGVVSVERKIGNGTPTHAWSYLIMLAFTALGMITQLRKLRVYEFSNKRLVCSSRLLQMTWNQGVPLRCVVT